MRPRTQITCPTCGRTSWNPHDRANGWCGHCNAATAPAGVHPDLVTITVAADRCRRVVGEDDDATAKVLVAIAELLEVCARIPVERLGLAGPQAAVDLALSVLRATRHLETP